MKILITGGAGFIASHIAQIYLKHHHQVFIIDKKPITNLCSEISHQVIYYQQDLLQPGLKSIFAKIKPDVVNHHAALISVSESSNQPICYEQNNVLATLKLLTLSAKYQIKQFIFASSVAVYGNIDQLPITENYPCQPESFYGLNKYSCENYIKLFASQFRTTIFRYANVYGPRQNSSAEGGVIAIFARNLASHQPVNIYGDGHQTRDFIYVNDVAKANLLALDKPIPGIYHIASNTQVSINQLYNYLQDISRSDLKPVYKSKRVGEIDHICLDYTKAQKELNWQPRFDLSSGLTQTYQYFLHEKL